MLTAPGAKFVELNALGGSFPVLGLRIIAFFAITALQGNNFSWHNLLLMSRVERTLLSAAFDLLLSLLNQFLQPNPGGQECPPHTITTSQSR